MDLYGQNRAFSLVWVQRMDLYGHLYAPLPLASRPYLDKKRKNLQGRSRINAAISARNAYLCCGRSRCDGVCMEV